VGLSSEAVVCAIAGNCSSSHGSFSVPQESISATKSVDTSNCVVVLN
jgi:hypothetical protein